MIYYFLCYCLSCTTTTKLILLGSTNLFHLRSTMFESAAASNPTSSRNQHHMVAPATPQTNRTKPPSISLGGLLLLYSPSWRHMVVKGWCSTNQRFMMIAGLTIADTHQNQHITRATAIQVTIRAMPPPTIGVLRLPCILVWMGTIPHGLTLQWAGPWAQTEQWAAWLEWIGNHCSLAFGFVHLNIGLISAANFQVSLLSCSCVLVLELFSYCLVVMRLSCMLNPITVYTLVLSISWIKILNGSGAASSESTTARASFTCWWILASVKVGRIESYAHYPPARLLVTLFIFLWYYLVDDFEADCGTMVPSSVMVLPLQRTMSRLRWIASVLTVSCYGRAFVLWALCLVIGTYAYFSGHVALCFMAIVPLFAPAICAECILM